MAENVYVGGTLWKEVDYITLRNDKDKDINFYPEGSGGGGSGLGSNYRTATKEEIDKILNKVVI